VLGAIDSTVTVERFIDAGDHVAAVGRTAAAPGQAASRSTWPSSRTVPGRAARAG
jgi:hypothetical protein